MQPRPLWPGYFGVGRVVVVVDPAVGGAQLFQDRDRAVIGGNDVGAYRLHDAAGTR